MDVGRIHRILRIITLLQTGRGYNAAALSVELGVAERTIYRDLQILEAAGIPYHYDPETKTYSINGDFFLPPVQLTLNEALSLSTLASQLAGQKQIPLVDDAWRGMAKIQSQLPPRLREELAATNANLLMQTARTSPQIHCEDFFHRIRKAIADRRKLLCVYESTFESHAGVEFNFRPYALFFSQRAWYVVGFNELRNEERCLKLNRFKKIESTDFPFMIPDDWSLEAYLGNAWRMIRGDKRYRVQIRFDAEMSRTMADTLWHPTQKVAIRDDGSAIFECEVDGLTEIVWWVLGYGPHAEILHPPELRQMIFEMASQMSRLYGK